MRLKTRKALELENRVQQLEKENKILKERLVRQELYSRRDNIKIWGIKEKANEDCEQKLLMIFNKFCPDFNSRTFTAVHRVGRQSKDIDRPIIARFHQLKDKILLQSHSREIYQHYHITIIDDFPPEIQAARKILLPILHVAKSLPEFNSGSYKPKLVEDKLYVNGIRYGLDNLQQLPQQLRLERVKTPSRNGITAFYSKFAPLSNHYPSHFKIGGEVYNCMEQYFMTIKATEFNDQEAVFKIKAETDAPRMKKIGKSVKNFHMGQWLEVAEERIMPGLMAKFSQNHLLKEFRLSTGDTDLIEASYDKVWGIGKSLRDKDLWNRDKWTGKNRLGILLMRVRSNLRK